MSSRDKARAISSTACRNVSFSHVKKKFATNAMIYVYHVIPLHGHCWEF